MLGFTTESPGFGVILCRSSQRNVELELLSGGFQICNASLLVPLLLRAAQYITVALETLRCLQQNMKYLRLISRSPSSFVLFAVLFCNRSLENKHGLVRDAGVGGDIPFISCLTLSPVVEDESSNFLFLLQHKVKPMALLYSDPFTAVT